MRRVIESALAKYPLHQATYRDKFHFYKLRWKLMMPENPHAAILNREEPREVVEKHFTKQLELLRDIANYGSNLVVRAFNSTPKRMADVVVCGVLLKQIVAMTDAVEVLLSSGCGHASFLPARTAFEASIYLDWILAGDSERRATRYIVSNYRDERVWAKRVIPGTTEEVAFNQIAKTLGIDIHATRPTLVSEAQTHLAEVSRILSQPELQAIDQEFTAMRKRQKKRKHDPEWYELDGLTSIRKVAEKVNRLPEYEFFYSKGSKITHTASYKDHISFGDGKVQFKPIRHLADVNMLLNFVISVSIGTYMKILKQYRPAELKAFGRKYLNDWREPFQNVVPVKYDF